MDNILFSILAFVAALGVLVTVHEFGHFWVARKLGVKVLCFSVGFGKPLWRYQRTPDDVEYVIAAIPLGGYVKMLDEREEPVPDALLSQSFNRQPLRSRIAIVAAGPLFNFALAILAYWIMFVVGIPGIKPMIGSVDDGSVAARAGLQSGYEIIAIDDVETPTWNTASMTVIGNMLSQRQISLRVENEYQEQKVISLALPEVSESFGKQDGLVSLGIHPWRPEIAAVIGDIKPNSPADNSGLQAGDLILSANGQIIKDWFHWVEFVRERPEQMIDLVVTRAGMEMPLMLTPERIGEGDEAIGRIGAAPQYKGDIPEELKAIQHYAVHTALWQAMIKTWNMSIMSLQVMGRMIVGQVSVENLSGPITIAQYAGFSAQAGLVSFLGFLAVVSLSLGVINLLPIPVLDGGHLLYYGIEFVKGSPLSEEAQFFGQRIGIALVVALMSLALYNDLMRLFG